jgi:hypothetical protein
MFHTTFFFVACRSKIKEGILNLFWQCARIIFTTVVFNSVGSSSFLGETASECMVNIYRTGIKIILMSQMYDK